MSSTTSLCVDGILAFGKKNKLAEPQVEMKQPLELYDDGSNGGFLLNTASENVRKIPDNIVSVLAGENVSLKYHIGCASQTEDIDNALILLNIANCQTKMNEQSYYYVDTESGKTAYGEIFIQAPNEPGMYEISGWSVPNPFNENITECKVDIPMAMRFTLEVK